MAQWEVAPSPYLRILNTVPPRVIGRAAIQFLSHAQIFGFVSERGLGLNFVLLFARPLSFQCGSATLATTINKHERSFTSKVQYNSLRNNISLAGDDNHHPIPMVAVQHGLYVRWFFPQVDHISTRPANPSAFDHWMHSC